MAIAKANETAIWTFFMDFSIILTFHFDSETLSKPNDGQIRRIQACVTKIFDLKSNPLTCSTIRSWFHSSQTWINTTSITIAYSHSFVMHISQSDKKQLKFITVVYKPATNDWIMSVLYTRRAILNQIYDQIRNQHETLIQHIFNWCDHHFPNTIWHIAWALLSSVRC